MYPLATRYKIKDIYEVLIHVFGVNMIVFQKVIGDFWFIITLNSLCVLK